MRAVAAFVVLATLIGGAASIAGDAAASHDAAPIVRRDAVSPIWSPDGKQLWWATIGYSSTASGLNPMQLRIVRTSSKSGGRLRTIWRENRNELVWSMAWVAGGRILFGGDDLRIVSVRGGKPQRIVFPDCESQDRCTAPAFFLSPNRKVAAVDTCDCGDPHGGVQSGIGLVTLSPGKEPVPTLTPFTGTAMLAFSPDSTQLVYTNGSAVMALPVAGGDPVPIAQSGIPGAELVPSDVDELQWSPDGRWLEYLEGDKLEAAPTNGDSPPRVLGTNVDFGIAWSRSSKTIAYTSAGSLMTVRPDGSHPTVVVRGHRRPFRYADVGEPQWSPDGSHLAFTAVGVTDHRVWTVRPNGRNLTRRG